MTRGASAIVLALIIAALLTVFVISEASREIARRVRRWHRQRAEYRKYRSRAVQFVRSAAAIEADLDWDLVSVLRRQFPQLNEDDLYAAAFERIRDSEGRDLTPARMTRVFAYCRAAFVEERAPRAPTEALERIADTPRAS